MILYFILGYVVVGVILNFVGPAGKTANEAIKESGPVTIEDFIKRERIRDGINRLCIMVVIRCIILLFWPVLYFILIPWDYFFGHEGKFRKARERGKFMEQHEKNKGLFFSQMGGAGHITCNSCGYHQPLVSFIHSFPMEEWNEAGFQCQECGKSCLFKICSLYLFVHVT
jgi:hypothetical protein